ncbi:MAG: hypothetical protein IPM23_00255 [Candidatus Melainabacteria bacterium]|nr:hypothetical protein [Candidatus Melainabacteria bacterium]
MDFKRQIKTTHLEINCLGASTSDLDQGLDCLDRVKLMREAVTGAYSEQLGRIEAGAVRDLAHSDFNDSILDFIEKEDSPVSRLLKSVGIMDDSLESRLKRFGAGLSDKLGVNIDRQRLPY